MKSLPRFSLLLLLGLLSTHGCKCQEPAPAPPTTQPNKDYQLNWKTLNLKGKVKSIQEVDYQQHIPDSELQYFVTKEHFWFDTAGNVTRRKTFVQQERFHTDYHYTYDAAGNYVELKSYDEQGKLKFTQRNTFDAEGNLLESIELDENQQPRRSASYTYTKSTSEGTTSVTKVAASGLKFETRYDSLGRMIQTTVIGRDTKAPFNSRTVYTYDQDNNVIEEVEYKFGREDRFSNKRLSTYDASKLLTSLSVIDNDNPSRSYERSLRYDQYGNIVEHLYKSGQEVDPKRSYTNTFEYDAQGNWIKRDTFKVSGEPKSSIRRQIEYY